jgi:phosphate transport system substrate-binding protein
MANRSTLWSLVLLAALSRSPFSQAANEKITVTGSSTVAPLASEIAKRFEARHPTHRVDVQSGGSSRGIADARQGLADVGMVSRALKPEEKDLSAFTIAKDGICLIVHKDNPIAKLEGKDIVAIYTGKITNWKQVGGKDASITVVNKAEGRSTLELFVQHFKLNPQDIKAQVIIGDNQQGIKTVAGNPNSIGYVSIGSAEYEAKAGAALKLLPMGGVGATTENVRNGTFPISRPLNLVTKMKPEGLVKDFVTFAQSKDVNDIVKEQFFVPVVQ